VLYKSTFTITIAADCYLLVWQVFYEATRRMLRLYHSDCISSQTIDDLQFIDSLIHSTESKIQSKIAPCVLNLGIIEYCQYICRKKLFRKKLFDGVDKRLPVGTRAVLDCLSCAVNLTDISKDACHRVIDIGLHEDIFAFLNLESMDPSKVKFCKVQSALADSVMSVTYNVIQAS